MGPLAGFKYKEVVRKLRNAGFVFDRNAKGSHEIWWNPDTPKELPSPTIPVISQKVP
jgi:predicted RNA binding protein YcfA (HicA-like mRNA interferase family)